ncbi:antitermination protein NusG [Niastella koreensis]|uniref:NusG antitermination factor n=2 Tax=Niastella koreensis TaxID=354356 RepID=G8TK30_NIAKG|nr:UpxY family transcription antiterminator [Niastella koreensis]AEW02968.1 NusG antitermination factor [Niastella koreensis GR20-10]OQP55284.1 antitermination protein NusG [Niastella koreensis]
MAATTSKKWFAVYTRPRWEKKVHKLLEEKGIESYCPLNKVHRKWSDRIKIVDEPLFKSYVFVKVNEEEKTPVRMTEGVVNFIYWLGKPAIIKEKEIEAIKKFLNDFHDVEVSSFEIKAGKKVRVDSGIFMGKQGTVRKVLNKKVEVVIESIGFVLSAYIDKSKIVLLEK